MIDDEGSSFSESKGLAKLAVIGRRGRGQPTKKVPPKQVSLSCDLSV